MHVIPPELDFLVRQHVQVSPFKHASSILSISVFNSCMIVSRSFVGHISAVTIESTSHVQKLSKVVRQAHELPQNISLNHQEFGLKIYIVEERICLYIYEQLKMPSKIIFLRFFSKFLMDDISYDKTAFLSRDLFLSSIFAEHNNSFVQLFNFTTSTLNFCLGTEKFTSIFIIHQLCTFFFNHCRTSELYLSLRNI